MEITARKPGTRGFTPIPKRWVVERTYGWVMLHRRLARDYETLPTRSEAVIHIAMTDLMAHRLTGENIISWRDPTPQTNDRFRDGTSDENDLSPERAAVGEGVRGEAFTHPAVGGGGGVQAVGKVVHLVRAEQFASVEVVRVGIARSSGRHDSGEFVTDHLQ